MTQSSQSVELTPREEGSFSHLAGRGQLGNYDCAIANSTIRANVIHLQTHEIASSQLAVDSEIEHCEIALAAFELQTDPNGPDVLWSLRALLAEQASFVPRASNLVGIG
jgi:hypothetical protein